MPRHSRMQRMRKGLQQQQEAAVQDKTGSGGRTKVFDLSVFNPEPPVYKPVYDANNYFDLLPWEVQGVCYHKSKAGEVLKIESGEFVYFLDYWIHKNVGINNDEAICLVRTLGKPCPICENREQMKGDNVKSDDYKSLYPQRRTVYQGLDPSDLNKGIQIIHMAFTTFEKGLRLGINAALAAHGEIYIADLVEGWRAKFWANKKTMKSSRGSFDYPECVAFELLKRDKAYKEQLLDMVFPLEKALNIMDYDTIANLHYGGSVEGGGDAGDYYEAGSNPRATAQTGGAPAQLSSNDFFEEPEDVQPEPAKENPDPPENINPVKNEPLHVNADGSIDANYTTCPEDPPDIPAAAEKKALPDTTAAASKKKKGGQQTARQPRAARQTKPKIGFKGDVNDKCKYGFVRGLETDNRKECGEKTCAEDAYKSCRALFDKYYPKGVVPDDDLEAAGVGEGSF